MISHQRGRIEEKDETENDERKGNREMLHGFGERNVLAIFVSEHLEETCADEVGSENRGRGNKGKEISVVAFSDTVVEPHTVVVMGLDAVVTEATVVSTRRPPDIASSAVLNWDFHGRRVGLG